jgi:hypothetical protein
MSHTLISSRRWGLRQALSRALSGIVLSACVLVVTAGPAQAQGIRFSNTREVAIPDYATLRIGPFYSTIIYSQSVGYRYSRSTGTGTEYYFNNERGVITEEGEEFPIISRLNFRNYLLISRNMDLDASIAMSYEYYPLDTQDDEFNIDIVEEGVYGVLSTGFRLTPFVQGIIYDRARYQTDYIDLRGEEDRLGGEAYENFQNTLGMNIDWLLAKDKKIAATVSRYDEIPRDDEFDYLERTTYSEGVAFEYAVIPGLVVGARAAYAQHEYDDPERRDAREEDYSFYTRFSRGLGLGFRVTDFTTVNANIGYSRGYAASGSTDAEAEEDDEDSETVTGGISMTTRLRRDLKHTLSYGRSLTRGFESAFETTDRYSYRINWTGKATSASLYTGVRVVDPSSRTVNEYSDWVSGASVSYPIIPAIRLQLSSIYSVRDNKVRFDGGEVDPEFEADYETWTSRIGTSFAVTRSIDFTAYAQHAERDSDAADLAYTQDLVGATFTYNYKF